MGVNQVRVNTLNNRAQVPYHTGIIVVLNWNRVDTDATCAELLDQDATRCCKHRDVVLSAECCADIQNNVVATTDLRCGDNWQYRGLRLNGHD